MMSTKSVLRTSSVEVDNSPPCKRARYDSESDDSSRWTLSKNDLVLHSVYDSGIERLATDAEFHLDLELSRHAMSFETHSTQLEQVAVLEASLPENTLYKLSMGEFDSILRTQNNCDTGEINYFERLSDEVVLNIFHMLSKTQLGNVALVCRRFSQLVEDESLWTRMDVSSRNLEKGALGIILSRQVIILRLARSKITAPAILPNVKAYMPNFSCRLMYLDLTMASVSPPTLVAMFNKCKRLKKLSLESVEINDSVLTALASSTELEVLNLAMAIGFKVAGMKTLLCSCTKLRELNLSWTYLNSETIDFICENLPMSLDRLNFSGCRKLLNDENVAQIISNCPNLRELDLSDSTSITGEAVKMLTALDDLNFLSLSRCYMIPHRSLLCLKKMKNLVYLDIHGTYINVNSNEFKAVIEGLGKNVNINKFKFSSIARPTVGVNKSRIWNIRVRD